MYSRTIILNRHEKQNYIIIGSKHNEIKHILLQQKYLNCYPIWSRKCQLVWDNQLLLKISDSADSADIWNLLFSPTLLTTLNIPFEAETLVLFIFGKKEQILSKFYSLKHWKICPCCKKTDWLKICRRTWEPQKNKTLNNHIAYVWASLIYPQIYSYSKPLII